MTIFVFIFYYLLKNFCFNTKYTILGLDISNQYKGVLSWEKLEGNNSFIILRAVRCVDTNRIKGQHSYVCLPDTNFKNNWYDLEKNKFVRGAYHRYSPGVNPFSQFEVFKNNVTIGDKDLPPILDIQEIQNNKDEINLAFEWLKLANLYYHKTPIIYLDYYYYLLIKKNNWINECNLSFFEQLIFLVKSKNKPKMDKPIFWQYDHNKQIKGFQENVDLIAFTGDTISFKKIITK